ncbi:MAG: penicillin-binding protein 2, partial [Acidobacteria bacterium]|nr:penicillin-binding protein 2 [Acidobacteriota bacterium]
DQNRIRILPIPARRGVIYDRHGRVLVTSQPAYNIVLSKKDVGNRYEEFTTLLAEQLGIEREWMERRFEEAKYEPNYESIVVKTQASPADVAWVEAHQFDYPMIRAEEAPQRLYLFGQLAAHALGYVGEVSKKQLNNPESQYFKEKGFKLGDIVGKSGIELTYNDILMGQDGERRVLVDSRGRIISEIDRTDPIQGRDLYSTLDLDIQQTAEEQTDTMPAGRGAIVVTNPNNGEVLAMVSHPAYDPNTFSQRAKTQEGKEEIRELQEDPDKPLYNRVIQGQFPPGSTWKLFTTTASLNEGVITPSSSRVQDGGIQLGNYFMNSLSHMGMPDIVTAIQHSCDGYFYRLGLKLGPERFEKWVNIFQFGHRTGIDLPNESRGIAPTPTTKASYARGIVRSAIRKRCEAEGLEGEARDKCVQETPWTEADEKMFQRESRFTDYDMASSAFGQGQNASTPIQLARYVGVLSNGGHMHTPHLLLRAGAGVARNGSPQPEARYSDKNPFEVPMAPEFHDIIKQGMWRAVNAGGTGTAAAVPGFDVCGKTGTAQVTSNDRMTKATNDHAWFISFAPRDKAELAMVILTENAGRGGRQSAPRAKAIYEDYVRRTHPDLAPKADLAKK